MAQENEDPRKKIRLTKEQKENGRAVARFYTIIKVSRDEDFCKQIGSDIYFDLVDHDKVHSFRIPKQMPFNLFKEEVAKEFGVPVQFQRFWLWAKRQNHTYRLTRSLRLQEETQSVEKLREKPQIAHNAELNFFLEVNCGPELHPIPAPDKTQQDILLFFKLYDPKKEQLQKPTVTCEHIYKEFTFGTILLDDGDIICFQKPLPADSMIRCRYPDVPSFLEYVLDRRVVYFQSLEKLKEDDFSLELSKVLTYDNVTKRIARHLVWMTQPKSDLLLTTKSDIFYYEVLDIPLPVLQGLKTLNVSFHHANKDTVIHPIRLPSKSTVGDVLEDLKTKVIFPFFGPLNSHPNAELRLLKVFNHMIYKVFPLSEKIEDVKDQYFTLRAEGVSRFLYCSNSAIFGSYSLSFRHFLIFLIDSDRFVV
ncbi:hypothetical protein MKX01_002838 [Papaver californicum]|nr:hypothetical protein MKX01_002838 [Papaver californicum]